MCNVNYYKAHELGSPEGEVVSIKIFTTVGGKRFDRVEPLKDDASKKEQYWYMHVLSDALTKDVVVESLDI